MEIAVFPVLGASLFHLLLFHFRRINPFRYCSFCDIVRHFFTIISLGLLLVGINPLFPYKKNDGISFFL